MKKIFSSSKSKEPEDLEKDENSNLHKALIV